MRNIQIIILLLLSGCINAQEVEFTATATPSVLRVGEQFNLTYSANQELQEFNLPEIQDLELLEGPIPGHSQNFISVNGKVTTSSTYQYTYFLRANKEGKVTIPSATIKYKNKLYRSNTVNIEVEKASSHSSSQAQPVSNHSKQASEPLDENDLFVRLVLDKKQAYLGEQIMATIKIYTKTKGLAIDFNFKGPEFAGFFTEPIETPPLRNLQHEEIEGESYATGILRRLVIIPQKTGELIIQPFNLDIALRREVRRRISDDPFFDDFSIPDVEEIPVKLKSNPVTLSVKPLPGNAPPTFKGAVGRFSINSSLSSTEATTNEPLTLKLSVLGKGNLKLINEVVVNIPVEMEQYDPVISTKLENPLSGSKTFEYMLIPKVAGNFIIPPVEFTYFDPDAGQYKTLKTKALKVHVVKGKGDTLISVNPGLNKEDVKLLNQDIRFIKTNSLRLSKKERFYGNSPWFYFVYFFVIAAFTAFILLRNKIIKQHADLVGMRLRRADKYARKRLKKCENLLKQGNDSSLYEEMLGALWGYLSHKLSIPVSALSKDSCRAALLNRLIDEKIIDQLFQITDTCEMARYGHIKDIGKEELYKNALHIITVLHQKLR